MEPNNLKAFLAFFLGMLTIVTIMVCHAELPIICSHLTVAFSERTIQRAQTLLTVMPKLTLILH